MADEELVECYTGFLTAQNKQGQISPFLVRVREDDIVWKLKIPENIKSIVSNNITANNTLSIDSSYMTKPESSLVIKSGADAFKERWGILISPNLSCTIRKRLYIFKSASNGEDGGFAINANGKMMSGLITLPIKLSASNWDKFSIIPTRSMVTDAYDPFISASINVRPVIEYDAADLNDDGSVKPNTDTHISKPYVSKIWIDFIDHNNSFTSDSIGVLATETLLKNHSLLLSISGIAWTYDEEIDTYIG